MTITKEQIEASQPAVSVPDGWKLVPVEPTEAIKEAMAKKQLAYLETSLGWREGSLWNAPNNEGISGKNPGLLLEADGIYRAMLAAAPQPATKPVAVEVPEELQGVPEVLEEGRGMWRTCTGCHEVFEGYPVGEYPYSKTMRCDLGSGCFECGGIGAIWDTTDYEEMGRHLAQYCATPPADLREGNERAHVLAAIEPAIGWGKHCDQLMKHFSDSFSEKEILQQALEECAEVAASAVMKFRHKIGGRYYPGYHEDMRDAVKASVKSVADKALTTPPADEWTKVVAALKGDA